MLTTTTDGLWVLQVLSRTEVLAPELGLRPYLPSVETERTALNHPVAEELRSAAVINDRGGIDDILLEWLTVLSRRDVALLLDLRVPVPNDLPERVILARFAQWWVALERKGTTVRLTGIGIATSEESAARLIGAQIQRVCGATHPASFRPVTLDTADLLANVSDGDSLRSFLDKRRLDTDQVAVLSSAADTEQSAHAGIVALQSGATGMVSTVEAGAVTLIDTAAGRLVSERVDGGGRTWMILSPGSEAAIAAAVQRMMRRLPTRDAWHSHRKAI